MYYQIITDPREGYGPYRVTTRGYDYSVRQTDGAAVIDYHWHPVGLSHEKRPHLHLGSSQLRADAVLSNKQHILTGRLTFESVIRDLLGMGAAPVTPTTPSCSTSARRRTCCTGPGPTTTSGRPGAPSRAEPGWPCCRSSWAAAALLDRFLVWRGPPAALAEIRDCLVH
ncbi:hypothetical protein [Micromonospora sediminicola]|uniref:hypothetical protein n=1 Tax=Micromonospora sediminicola TaxID=946078 RepID=UPI00379C25A5